MNMKTRIASLLISILFITPSAFADITYNLWWSADGFPCAAFDSVKVEGVQVSEFFPGSLYQNYEITIDSNGDGLTEESAIAIPVPGQGPTHYPSVSECSDHEDYPTGSVQAYEYNIHFSNGQTANLTSGYCSGVNQIQGRRLISFANAIYCLLREGETPN
jgi:hypothetical protein